MRRVRVTSLLGKTDFTRRILTGKLLSPFYLLFRSKPRTTLDTLALPMDDTRLGGSLLMRSPSSANIC